nr:hypothetical protein [Xanthomonadales bacterium]
MTGSRTPTRPTVDPDIPQVVGKAGAEGQALTAIKQILDVGLTKNGASPYDGFVRVRDLVALGLAQVDMSGSRGRITGGGSIPGGSGEPNPFLQPPNPGGNPRPTTFTGIRTTGLWNGIRIFWNYPSVTSTGAALEYAGVEVYAAQELDGQIPSFAQAVSVGTVSGATNFFTHDLGPAGFGETWWYWLRWLYITNSQFPIPYSQFTPGEDSQGVRGRSDPSPSELVDALVGQVTDDLLELGLGNRIARGDFVTAGVPVSLNARLLVADATGQAAIAQVAAVRGSLQTVLTGTYSVRTDLNGYVTGFGFTASVGVDDLNPFLPGDQLFDSAFIIRANRFAIQVPNEPGAPPEFAGGRIPFIVGQIVNPYWVPPDDDPAAEPTVANGGIIDAVGIDGTLAVKGTIHADALKAGTIAARHIDAFS